MIAKKVCAIGGATLDLIIAYEDMEMMTLENSDSARNYLLLEEGSKIEVSDLHYYSGGGATNAAFRQDLDVYLFCKIGDDSAGKMVIEDLKGHGVNTDNFYLSKTIGTSSSFVVPALSGDRTIFAYRGANTKLSKDEQLKNTRFRFCLCNIFIPRFLCQASNIANIARKRMFLLRLILGLAN